MAQVLRLQREKHLLFIRNLDARINRLDYWQTEHLRMSGIYWALTALLLLKPDLTPACHEETFNEASPLTRSQVIDFVFSCQRTTGGFGGNAGHDAHLTFTLSAIQILCMLDAIHDERFAWPTHLECKFMEPSLLLWQLTVLPFAPAR